MIILDRELERLHERGKPIQVALVGAGAMGAGIALQTITAIKGMRLAVISNRTVSKASEAYRNAGVEGPLFVESPQALERAITEGVYAITDNPDVLCEAENIDVIIEATGEVEFGANVVLKAIKNRKHVVMMNAELDAVLGPIIKVYADRAGVVVTNADGDQPGVIMNLYRYVKTIGFRPVLAGNMKGLQDPYRTPETQRGFAEKYHLKPTMATSLSLDPPGSMSTCRSGVRCSHGASSMV